MIRLKVGGMTCAGCVAAVKRAIATALPDASVSVDLARGEVALDGQADRDGAAAAIRGAGFTVEAGAA
jgi:copper chaperone